MGTLFKDLYYTDKKTKEKKAKEKEAIKKETLEEESCILKKRRLEFQREEETVS